MASPFLAFKNTVLVFEIEDTGSDVLDSSGNPNPNSKTVKLEAYMKPVVLKSDGRVDTKYVGANINETRLRGFLVIPDKMPKGIKHLDKTVEANYRGQRGVFTLNLTLQSSVKADLITGHDLSGTFKVLGGI